MPRPCGAARASSGFRRFGSFQPLHVQQILITTGRALVDHELLSREDGRLLVGEARMNALGPRFEKFDSVNRRDHIDTDWLDSDLENQTRPGKVGDRQILQRSAEVLESREDTRGIARVWPHPDV